MTYTQTKEHADLVNQFLAAALLDSVISVEIARTAGAIADRRAASAARESTSSSGSMEV